MPTIKFSHQYNKMVFAPFENKAYVLDVWALRREALSQAFIDYDTKFEIETKGKDGPKFDHFKLPPADVYLVIVLWTGGFLWTTIRTATKEKMNYYKSLIGQEVDIEIAKS